MTFPRCLGTIVKGKGLLQACRSEYCRRGAPLTAPRPGRHFLHGFRATGLLPFAIAPRHQGKVIGASYDRVTGPQPAGGLT